MANENLIYIYIATYSLSLHEYKPTMLIPNYTEMNAHKDIYLNQPKLLTKFNIEEILTSYNFSK